MGWLALTNGKHLEMVDALPQGWQTAEKAPVRFRQALLDQVEGRRIFEGIKTGKLHTAKVKVETDGEWVIVSATYHPTEEPAEFTRCLSGTSPELLAELKS